MARVVHDATRTHKVKDPKWADKNFEVASDPDMCPICHHGIQPSYLAGSVRSDEKCQLVFRCPRHACLSVFIAYYAGSLASSQPWRLERVEPVRFKPADVPSIVSELSADFVEIYNQALKAESVGLDQICGTGIRKALEFLIKDFAKEQARAGVVKGTEEAIEGATLAQCINNYVVDANVKSVAQRAAWLGNDETHYVRKWESRDIGDLKLLVRLVVNWIDNVLLTRQYESEMQKGGTGDAK